MDYAERMVRLSEVQQQMSYFIYSCRVQIGDKPRIFDEHIGTLFYVDKGELYMKFDELTKTWKFQRDQYKQSGDDLLL
jgi:hypothetical protein